MDVRLFGERLRQLREQRGLSQKDLAVQLGVRQSAISWWERGEREPSLSNAVKAAEFFGVNVQYFVDTASKPDAATSAPSGRRRAGRGR
jgi:transcriptional regulator with XRE-family HTH domain